MADTSTNLRSLFNTAKAKEAELIALPSATGDQYQETLHAAIDAYEACRSQVIQLALFSSNEDFDEIATSDLQYLAIDFLLAELLLRSYGGTDRASTLRKAVALYETFLERLDEYGLLKKDDKKLLERLQSEQLTFSLVSTTDFGERRRIKISRFQEEKALKQKLEYLREKEQQVNVDDETIRELRVAELQFQVNKTFDSLDMVSQEYAIVSRNPQPHHDNSAISEDDLRSRDRQHQDTYSERLDTNLIGGLGRSRKPGGPLLTKQGKPLQPFTLTTTTTRQDLQNGVFKPGHNLPTMTIEEYLEEEKRRGGIIEGGGEKSGMQPEPDEDNVELADRETMKAREWDEFVEANPKGAGNTLNRG